MNRNNRKNNRKNSNKQNKSSGKIINFSSVAKDSITFASHGQLSAPSSTNSSGLLVVSTYNISTNMLSTWGKLAQMFQQWKILEVTFKYNPICATTTSGRVIMSISEDPADTPPNTVDRLLSARVCGMTQAYRPLSITYRPQSEWLWTEDYVSYDDRLEYPGVFCIGTDYFSGAITVGTVAVEYVVQFRHINTNNDQVSSLETEFVPVNRLVNGTQNLEGNRGGIEGERINLIRTHSATSTSGLTTRR